MWGRAPLRRFVRSSSKTGRLHAERLEVTAELCAAVAACRGRGGRVIAVGTTATRGLETAGESGELRPLRGETSLFIRPGYQFRIVDAMVTNFHLPGSSLLMLVCAFGGTERVLAAYRHAVASRYRFFSYGDAMFLERDCRRSAFRRDRHLRSRLKALLRQGHEVRACSPPTARPGAAG